MTEIGSEKSSILYLFTVLYASKYKRRWLNYRDEQDRAFRKAKELEGRRKVIVSTNIAESYITIPDVKYVIDFMLTKELNYDPMTKSESLNLSWVSKASSK